MSRNWIFFAFNQLGWLSLLVGIARGDGPTDVRRDFPPVVTAIAIDAHGDQLATAGDDHLIRIWDLERGDLLQVLTGHQDWVTGVAFSSDGCQLYSVGRDGMLGRWDLNGGALSPLRQQKTPINSLAYAADRQELLTVGFGCPLRRVGLQRLAAEETLRCPCRDMRIVVSSPDGSQFAAGGGHGHIGVWSSSDGSILHEWAAHDQRLRTLAYSPDGRCLVSAGEDRAICVWDTATGQKISHFDRTEGKILSLAVLSADRLAVGTSRNVIELWDLSKRTHIGSLTGHTGSVAALAQHQDWLVSSGFDAQIRIWRVGPDGDAVASRVLDAGARPVRRR